MGYDVLRQTVAGINNNNRAIAKACSCNVICHFGIVFLFYFYYPDFKFGDDMG